MLMRASTNLNVSWTVDLTVREGILQKWGGVVHGTGIAKHAGVGLSKSKSRSRSPYLRDSDHHEQQIDATSPVWACSPRHVNSCPAITASDTYSDGLPTGRDDDLWRLAIEVGR